MQTITSLLVLLTGLLVRLAIPITITAVLIHLLRKWDARWQSEAQPAPRVKKPECWKIKGCTPKQASTCEASRSRLPCWQVFRKPNGYLREECLSCEVFHDAPIPKHTTRRYVL